LPIGKTPRMPGNAIRKANISYRFSLPLEQPVPTSAAEPMPTNLEALRCPDFGSDK